MILIRLFVLEGRELAKDGASKLMLVVIVITFLQAANPRGGGIGAGVAALLFTAVPLAWYFIGRELPTARAMRWLYGGLVGVACVVALYGLSQTWNGLPSWDAEWVRQTGYAALSVGGVIRAFGTFSSAADTRTSSASPSSWRSHSPWDAVRFLPAVPLLAVALFYESSRGIMVTTIFAVIVVVAARTGNMRRAVVALAVCLVGLALAFTFARGISQGTGCVLVRPAGESSAQRTGRPVQQGHVDASVPPRDVPKRVLIWVARPARAWDRIDDPRGHELGTKGRHRRKSMSRTSSSPSEHSVD